MKDRELIKFTKSFIGGLGLGTSQMCFAICAPLASYLEFLGEKVKLIECEVKASYGLTNHFVIELEDKRILDPTAGQFPHLKMPPIYIGEMPKEYKIIHPDSPSLS